MVLSDSTRIRRISDGEYAHVVDIRRPLREIDAYQRRLGYVLSHRAGPALGRPLDGARCEFERVANVIRLGRLGAPEFGRIYQLGSEHLDVLGPRMVHPRESTPQPAGHAAMKEDDRRFVVARYADIAGRLAGPGAGFLADSLARFGMASRHSRPANRIVDYIIALESLLLDGSGEISFKLAHRVAALCGGGGGDADMLSLWEFTRAAYGFRSGIVHRSVEKPVAVGSRTIGADEASHRLNAITATAILRMVDVLGRHGRQSDILRRLDRSVYDRGILAELRKAWDAGAGPAAGTAGNGRAGGPARRT